MENRKDAEEEKIKEKIDNQKKKKRQEKGRDIVDGTLDTDADREKKVKCSCDKDKIERMFGERVVCGLSYGGYRCLCRD